jgi:DNA repair protein RecN (Recombination protein N)
VRANLRDLGFRQSEFEVKLTQLNEARPTGFDGVELLFSPNPGEPLKPLRTIASSGEISRVMLAIKLPLVYRCDPALVFDEITPTSAAKSQCGRGKDAKRRRSSGAVHHSPAIRRGRRDPICCWTKEVVQGRTHSRLTEVAGKARQEENARMLGGKTESALKHAATLLKACSA